MDITPLIKTVFGEYQAHVFSIIAVLARMQYNVNKTIAVQDIKLTNIKEDVKINTTKIEKHDTQIHNLDNKVSLLELKEKWSGNKEKSSKEESNT
ncbi:MAG: hypothetical protein GY714_18370 [Desulfobacterales bacterium]|nr:hypothetical protein [Desulfobacterales bacterium]